MLDISKNAIVWGTTRQVVGSLPTTYGGTLGTTTKGLAVSGMDIMMIKDISKKIEKY